MTRESLLKLVNKLNERIDRHGYRFMQNETLTRYALIDPLLRELGWNTEDPDEVIPEYRLPNGKPADYTLFASPDKPLIVVESKKLGEPLGKALDQGHSNADSVGAEYFLLTDGRRYELYESGKNSACGRFDLRGYSTADIYQNAVELSRPRFTSSSDLQPPNVQSESKDTNDLLSHPNDGWVPLTSDIAAIGMKLVGWEFPRDECIQFESGRPWWHLIAETTRWLVKNRHLDRGRLPIERSGNQGNQHVLSTEPETLLKPKEVLTGIWVETTYTSDNCVWNTIVIIKETGQDPSKFRVRIRPPVRPEGVLFPH